MENNVDPLPNGGSSTDHAARPVSPDLAAAPNSGTPDPFDPGPTCRARSGQDGAADEIGRVEKDLLRDEAAERKSDQVD